jgi:hypothetical protein
MREESIGLGETMSLVWRLVRRTPSSLRGVMVLFEASIRVRLLSRWPLAVWEHSRLWSGLPLVVWEPSGLASGLPLYV